MIDAKSLRSTLLKQFASAVVVGLATVGVAVSAVVVACSINLGVSLFESPFVGLAVTVFGVGLGASLMANATLTFPAITPVKKDSANA